MPDLFQIGSVKRFSRLDMKKNFNLYEKIIMAVSFSGITELCWNVAWMV